MHESKDPLARLAFTESDFNLEFLTGILNNGRFPSLVKSLFSQPLAEEKLAESKAVFNKLIHQLRNLQFSSKISSLNFCDFVGIIVRGNIALFEPKTFDSLLNSILAISVPPSNTELCQKLASALACLLYLHPVDYKTGYAVMTAAVTRSNGDFLDHKLGVRCLDTLTCLLAMNQDDSKTTLACFHALIQLLCHRHGLLHRTRPTPTELQQLVRTANIIWPFVFCTGNSTHLDEDNDTCGSIYNSTCQSSSSCGEVSDGSGVIQSLEESSTTRERKKIRLLATFCLRRLLTSKQICQEVWTSDEKRSFQRGLIGALCREPDARLREIFIVILGGLLGSMKQRFSVAEELSNWQPAAFIPYSVGLANELADLHRSLNWALLKERSSRHQVALLKIIASLVNITPYHRLRSGLISSLVKSLNMFHNRGHKDPSKTAQCFSHILAIWSIILGKTPTPEVLQVLMPTASSSSAVAKMLSCCRNSSQPTHSCWLVELCLHLVRCGPNCEFQAIATLRLQAISTLKAFVPSHYNLLVPSMAEIKNTVASGFKDDGEESRLLRPHLLRLCDALLVHIFGCLETKEAPSCLPLDYNWWFDLIGVLLDTATNSSDNSERWWTCQVVGSFFELLSLLPSFHRIPSLLSSTCTDLCARGVTFFTSLCHCCIVENSSKALRKLSALAILEGPFIPSNLLSHAMEVNLQVLSSASPRVACEIAYCLELCTLKALSIQHIPDGWNLRLILQAALQLSDFPLPDTQNITWTGQDGCRCEHALQTLANLTEIAAKSVANFESSDLNSVVRVFCNRLRTANITGAEKIRWNAALGSSRLLQNLPDNSLMVDALCEVFNADPYFKVRAYAGMSLLLQLLQNPNLQKRREILVCSVRFLCVELRQCSSSTATVDAAHYLTLCSYIAGQLLLQAGILALKNLEQSGSGGEDLKILVDALNNEENFGENLMNSLRYAKETKIASYVVLKSSRCGGLTGGGLRRMSNQPMVISFAERYDPLRGLRFDDSIEEFLGSLESFERETRRAVESSHLTPELEKGLTRLLRLITNGATVDDLRRTLRKATDNHLGHFRTTYD